MSVTGTHTDLPVLDQEFAQDPYLRYEWMRGEGPARQAVTVGGLTLWLVTRYGDARAVLTDPRVGKDHKRTGEIFEAKMPRQSARGEFAASLLGHMLNTDPPDHTRLRKLVMKAFTSGRVEKLRPWIERITSGLLDEMSGQSEVDLLDTFAFPLPITVISELLGIDESRRDEFRVWSNLLVGADRSAAVDATREMNDYLVQLVATKRREPADDLLSDLITASTDEDRLSETELVAMVFLLLIAGHETTVNLIGNAVLSLLRNPEQLAAVRADPDLVEGAIEETLRFEGPVNLATIRHTVEPVRIGDVEIPAGEIVLVALGSADRDAARFEDPDVFDVSRSTTGHLAFGHGIHFCVGAPLARMEGQIALRQLIERFPDLELAADPDELRWRFSTLMRGLESLPVRLRTGARR